MYDRVHPPTTQPSPPAELAGCRPLPADMPEGAVTAPVPSPSLRVVQPLAARRSEGAPALSPVRLADADVQRTGRLMMRSVQAQGRHVSPREEIEPLAEADKRDLHCFLQDCDRAGVRVTSHTVRQVVWDGRSCDGLMVEPDTFHSAVVAAGKELRRLPSSVLVDEPLPPELKERYADNTGAKALIAILNASRQPVRGESWDTTVTNHDHRVGLDACGAAEVYFGELFAGLEQQAATGDPACYDGDRPLGCQLLVGEGNRPIAIRKGLELPSTLALEPVTINGIPYPAGSLLRVSLQEEAYTNPSTGRTRYNTQVPGDECTVRSMREVAGASFLRLSAWAAPLGPQRQAFARAGGWQHNNGPRYEMVNDVSLAQLRDIARRALLGDVAQAA